MIMAGSSLAWCIGIGGLALLLHLARALTAAGAVVAATIGLTLALRLGAGWAVWVGFLFAIASAATRLRAGRKVAAKSSAGRTAADLFPVGSVIIFGALLSVGDPLGRLLVLAAMSFALADILASELGPLFPGRAVSFPYLRAVPHGTPGAVSAAGLLAGLVGGAITAIPALALFGPRALVAIWLAGQVGSLVDTAAGRLLPAQWWRRNDVANTAGAWSAAIVCIAARRWIGGAA